MNIRTSDGICATFSARVISPAELRTDDDGSPWLYFSTAVSDVRLADDTSAAVRIAYFGDDAQALAPFLVEDSRVHVEGRLITCGQQLALAATHVSLGPRA